MKIGIITSFNNKHNNQLQATKTNSQQSFGKLIKSENLAKYVPKKIQSRVNKAFEEWEKTDLTKKYDLYVDTGFEYKGRNFLNDILCQISLEGSGGVSLSRLKLQVTAVHLGANEASGETVSKNIDSWFLRNMAKKAISKLENSKK